MNNEQSALHHADKEDRVGAQEPVAERARRRITRRLMPFLVGAYLLAYIDRANLGIAKLQMQGALGFSDAVIGFGAGVFFIGYFLLEIPGSLIVERWSARKWFARIMISWGLVAGLTAFTSTPNQFYLSRFALGAAEAGFFPGVIVYLSHWFRYEDRTRAKSWFMMTQPLSVVIGTPVSRWILENVHWSGLEGWRWVFLLEGIPSIVCGIAALYYLPDRVPDAKWLPSDEKRWLAAELEKEAQQKTATGRIRIADAFRHPQTMLLIAVFFLVVTGNQAILFFLPSITESMKGLSITWRTAIIILPYLCSIGGILLNGFSSNRTGERRWHTAAPILITAAALGCAILAGDRLALVITCLAILGFTFQAYLPPFWTLPTAYLGKSAAATAIGTINSFGNLGGFAGPYIFGYLRAATGHFQSGLWFLTGCMLTSGLLATRLRVGNGQKSK